MSPTIKFSTFVVLIIFAITECSQGQGSNSSSDFPIAFECDDEGFFPNPKDCRKYFWCLDSSPANLGIVAHAFTCPSGLYFNTKTEACDYPTNVACKQKKRSEDSPRKKNRPTTEATTTRSVTTTEEELVATTTTAPRLSRTRTRAPTTTTTTTEAPPAASSPQITAELLAAALRINDQPRHQPTPRPDNLNRLLDLVNKLGGIENLQSLVENQNQGLNGRRPSEVPREAETIDYNQDARPCTTHGPTYFEPSYATPDRHESVRLEPTTETPLAVSSNEPHRAAVRHRRPQFDSVAQPSTHAQTPAPQQPQHTTINPFFRYQDPTRDNVFNSNQTPAPLTSAPAPPAALSPFAFSYNTPGGRVQQSPPVPAGLQLPVAATHPANVNQFNPFTVNDPFFAYNTPGRFAQPTTRAQVSVTEPTVAAVAPQPIDDRRVVRVPVRVTAGSVFRVPQEQPGTRRQPSRVRVQSTFAVAPAQPVPSNNLPGVLYDEEERLEANTQAAPLETPAPQILTTRKPVRRRPPQRAHLRNRQEENPVSALINLPPPNLPISQPVNNQIQPRPLPPRPQVPPQQIHPATLPPRNLVTSQFQPGAFTGFPSVQPQPLNRFSNLLSTSNLQPSTLPDIEDNIFVTDFPFYDLPERQTERPTTTTTSTTTTTTTTTTTPPPPPPTTRAPRREQDVQPQRAPRQRSRSQKQQRGQALPQQAPTTPKPTRRTTLPPLPVVDDSGPAVEMEPTSGVISCARRGVYAHPTNCGQFVVCAPTARNSITFRSYTHHCPAEQVYVEEVGRCRPGNKDKCEVYTS